MNVSIIIPCFNAAWVLESLSRNMQPFVDAGAEIIFVDDGSSDGSLEAFQALVPTALCFQQDRRGPGAARNLGARNATREYLQFLDADDTIEPGKFDLQIPLLERDNLDAIFSDWQMVVVNGRKENREPLVHAEAPGDLVDSMLNGWWVPSNACLIRREAYWAIGGHTESLSNLEDFDLWLRLAIAGRTMAYVPGHVASYYRFVQVQSRARGSRIIYWKSRESIFSRALEKLDCKGELTPFRRKAAAGQLHLLARNSFNLDRPFYEYVIRKVYELDPEFRPRGSWSYRTTARCFGLRFAERVSTLTRPLRFRIDPKLRTQYFRLGKALRG